MWFYTHFVHEATGVIGIKMYGSWDTFTLAISGPSSLDALYLVA